MTTLINTGSARQRPTFISSGGTLSPGTYEIKGITAPIVLNLIDLEGCYTFYNSDRSITGINTVTLIRPAGALITNSSGTLIADDLEINEPGRIITLNRPERTPSEYYVTISGIVNT